MIYILVNLVILKKMNIWSPSNRYGCAQKAWRSSPSKEASC